MGKPQSVSEALGLPLALLDGFLHPSMEEDQEQARRGRLHVRFGILGGIVAIVYSTFFFAIQHFWGGCMVAVSGLAIMQVPWIIRQTGNLTLSGHLLGAILLCGFAGLCAVGGGLQGYANAWMAAVPVCALLLMNLRGALIWSAVSFAAVVAFSAMDMADVEFLKTFDSDRESSIEAASHIGLLIFLSLLGLLFEQTRMEAFARLQEANARLAEANEELTDLNRQKNEFLNIAAHDLKNPLTIICGYADLLGELESPTLKQIRDQSAEILRSGEHMLEIISNILDVRAIEDGEMNLDRAECDTREIVEKLLDDYEGAAVKKDITLKFLADDEPLPAWTDPRAVRQIVDNLVSNAVKYTPRGGNVTVRQCISEEQLVIEVMDDGPGLSKEDQARLWEKFVRLTPRPTGGENSNGLGLWIIRRLAEEMGGSSFCRSAPNQGSIFGVSLPLGMDQANEAAEADSSLDLRSAADFDRLATQLRQKSDSVSSSDSEDVVLPS